MNLPTIATRAAVAFLGVFGLMNIVGECFHLPRVKMTYQRAGWDIRTVPAEEAWPLRGLTYFMAREAVALWAYYLRPFAD